MSSAPSSIRANPFAREYRVKKERRVSFPFDPILVSTVAVILLFSMLMLYSTTGVASEAKLGDALFYVKRQFVALIFGLVGLGIAASIPTQFFRKISFIGLPFALCLLVLPLIPGLGDSAGGASRWINLGFIRFQPGEIVKLLVIVFMAGFFARHSEKIGNFLHGVAIPLGCVGLVAALLLLQPDFGSSAVIALVVVGMALATGTRLRYLFFAAALLIVCGALLVWHSPYRMQRIVSFLTPWADPSGKGYQLIQSLIAVGSGQVFGLGLGESQQKLMFLPAAHTDFIFAVIAEELGFVGALFVIIAFLIMGWRGLRIADQVSEDTFSYALAVGLTLLLVVPALLNVGVVIGLLPTKGMVLPLLGYGGSSLICSLFAIGLLIGLHRSSINR